MENKELSTSLNDLRYIAKAISYSSFCPKEYRSKPFDILITIQMGHDVGLKPLQALKNISLIHGRPSMWGDSLLALVKASGKLEYCKEWQVEETAYCEVKRRGETLPTKCSFSMEDAKKAKLIHDKSTCWNNSPKRMLKMRARSFALRDAFPDVLCGIECREEIMDYQAKDTIYNGDNLLSQLKYEVSKKETMSKSNQLKDELSKKEETMSNKGDEFENQLPDEFGEDTIPTDKGDDLLNQLQHSYQVS